MSVLLPRSATRAAVLILSAGVLAGCAARPVATREPSLEERYASFSTRDAEPRSAAPLRAVDVAPLLGGSVASEEAPAARLQSAETTGTVHRLHIVLEKADGATSGWMTYAGASDADELRAAEAPPSEVAVRTELARLFPQTAMRVLEKPRRNRFGSYGLAVGIDPAGRRCAYGWQWIEDEPSLRGAASIHTSLCSKTARLDELAALLDGMRLENADALPRVAATARQKSARHRSHGTAPVRSQNRTAHRTPLLASDEPRSASSTSRVASRSDVTMPLEPAFRSSPELDLPLQALRGPTTGLHTAPALR